MMHFAGLYIGLVQFDENPELGHPAESTDSAGTLQISGTPVLVMGQPITFSSNDQTPGA